MHNCVVVGVEYQTAVRRLCRASSVNIGGDSTEGATDTPSGELQQSSSVKLALRKMLRSFAFCAPLSMRLGRLHAFLAKHCPEYAKSCLAVHPPTMLSNLLSTLDNPTIISAPLIAVEYHANLLTAADGNLTSFLLLFTSY